MQEHRAGDVFLTTQLGLPALWWYGGASLMDADAPGARLPDGSAIYELGYGSRGPDCNGDQWRDIVRQYRRAVLYMGFPDRPDGFDALVFDTLSTFGRITSQRDFSLSSRAAIIEIDRRTTAQPVSPVRTTLDRCVVVRRARRW
jgi:hypothetical protein